MVEKKSKYPNGFCSQLHVLIQISFYAVIAALNVAMSINLFILKMPRMVSKCLCQINIAKDSYKRPNVLWKILQTESSQSKTKSKADDLVFIEIVMSNHPTPPKKAEEPKKCKKGPICG